ncbi:Phage DNA packaging protein Nu1 [Bordetella ansorpii]|uniref:Phage DNA packaging protein Nu1 n=1 Tax=Bordetella ansorpii TaxID=288768 RepID=A0A157RLV6_9BORD|nr:terminase small subunit [Bordetella ansorpii]SAI58958.1 Phage DNA packaging protein Nu1 [Bordetella ansorpii]
MDLSQPVTQAAFGSLVGISQPAVSDLLSRGVLTQDEPAAVWLVEYCTHLREVAAGRQGDDGGLDLVSERARLAAAQADKFEMANAVTRKELAPVALIEQVLSKAGSRVAAILDAIPGNCKRLQPELGAAAMHSIRKEIARARNCAAAVSLDDLVEEEVPGDETEGMASDGEALMEG